MVGLIIIIIAAVVISATYIIGVHAGRYEGFAEGMDAAIAVYEEALREEAARP